MSNYGYFIRPLGFTRTLSLKEIKLPETEHLGKIVEVARSIVYFQKKKPNHSDEHR